MSELRLNANFSETTTRLNANLGTVTIREYDDYELLKNKPTLNGVELVGNVNETDPTVPAWAKAATKPTYSANEVGAIDSAEKGAVNGVATLTSEGKLNASQIPDYLDQENIGITKCTLQIGSAVFDGSTNIVIPIYNGSTS